jgi:hypothetical protein
VLGSRPNTTLSLTYINEYETYSISNEALNDPTFRDDLIALGLDPRTGTGRGTRSAIAIDGGRNTTNNLLEAKQGYVAAVHRTGRAMAGRDVGLLRAHERGAECFDRLEIGWCSPAGRLGSIDAIGDPRNQIPFFSALPLPRRRDEPAWMGPLRGLSF